VLHIGVRELLLVPSLGAVVMGGLLLALRAWSPFVAFPLAVAAYFAALWPSGALRLEELREVRRLLATRREREAATWMAEAPASAGELA
jgi:uncharacterized membrane protein